MTDELVPGKRTYIARHGEPYELPEQHTAEWGEYDGARTIFLGTPDAGGMYHIESVDEDDERVVVRVGAPISQTGPGGGTGRGVPPVLGYPFLDE